MARHDLLSLPAARTIAVVWVGFGYRSRPAVGVGVAVLLLTVACSSTHPPARGGGASAAAKRPDITAASAADGEDLRAARARLDQHRRVLAVGHRLLHAMPRGSRPGRSIGFSFADATPLTCRTYGWPADCRGALIVWVDPAGPAQAKVQAGDLVVAMQGRSVLRADDLEVPGSVASIDVRLRRAGNDRLAHIPIAALPLDVTFQILSAGEPDAYASHRTITVTTALVDLVDDDDQLAAVLGHELAHVADGHAPAADSSGYLSPPVFVRDYEIAADRQGLAYAAAAGYDPFASVKLMKKLRALARHGFIAPHLGEHPDYPERIEILERAAEQAGR